MGYKSNNNQLKYGENASCEIVTKEHEIQVS